MDKRQDVILVTGATGRQGGATARHLLARNFKVKVLTRKPEGESARRLKDLGAYVLKGDYDDPATLEEALDEIWGVFAVQNTWEAGVEREEAQGRRLAEIARRKGVQHFVYTSVGSAHRRTGIPHFDSKWRIEEKVRELDFPSCTILRPVFFMENFVSPSSRPALMEGRLAMGIKPSTPLQMIAVDDIGKFALLAFDQPERMNRREVDIAGDQCTMPKAAEILGKAMGRKVQFVQTPIEEVRKASADYAIMTEWFDKVGYNVDIQNLIREYGIRPTTLAEWAGKVSWK